jgi:hypothetical protein
MKKLLLLLVILIISMATFVSCEENTPIETNQMQYIGSSKISNNNVPSNVNGPAEEIQYYLDNKTEIVYMAVINHVGDKSWAGFTPLIDSDGTYTTYDEYLERFNLNQ